MKSLNEIKKLNESSENDLTKRVQELMYDLEKNYEVDLWLHYSKISNVIIIGKIVVSKENRGKGIGTKVMEEITDFADNENLRIALTPTKDFGGILTKLNKFYSGFGFVKYKGYEFRETLVRLPK